MHLVVYHCMGIKGKVSAEVVTDIDCEEVCARGACLFVFYERVEIRKMT